MQLNRLAHWKGASARGLVLRAGAVAAVAIFVVPVALLAHAHLERSEPTARVRLTSPPTAIRLWFSEQPEVRFTHIRLRAADSTEIALGPVARMPDDPLGVSTSIAMTLAPGTYTVVWRTAAADGHPTSGSFTFDVVGSAAPAPVAKDTARRTTRGNALVHADSTSEVSLNVIAATRWLEFIAMLAVVGAVVFRSVVLRLAERSLAGALPVDTRVELADSARRLAQNGVVLLLVAAFSRLYEEAGALLGPARAVDRSVLRDILLGTRWGAGWLTGVAGAIVAAIGFSVVRRARTDTGWAISALGSAGIVIAPALTGHASSTSPLALALCIDIVHVAATSAWLGALLSLLFASVPFVRGTREMNAIGSGPLVAGLVRAFHPVALTCAVIVVVTGVLAAWLRLPAISSLWATTYGRVLLLKLLFVTIVVVLGALNWRRMLPILGDESAARRITRTTGTELTFAALVLAVTAVLVSTSPP